MLSHGHRAFLRKVLFSASVHCNAFVLQCPLPPGGLRLLRSTVAQAALSFTQIFGPGGGSITVRPLNLTPVPEGTWPPWSTSRTT